MEVEGGGRGGDKVGGRGVFMEPLRVSAIKKAIKSSN